MKKELKFPLFVIHAPTQPGHQLQFRLVRIDDAEHLPLYYSRESANRFMESRGIALTITKVPDIETLEKFIQERRSNGLDSFAIEKPQLSADGKIEFDCFPISNFLQDLA